MEIPKHFLPKNAKEGDVTEIIVNKVARRKRNKDVDELMDDF